MPPAGDDYEPTMGTVQLLCHRRLRTVQKRVVKIQKAEEKLAAGGEIDDQQRELIDGKPLTMALLDEFTKLSQEIEKAVEEDDFDVRPTAASAHPHTAWHLDCLGSWTRRLLGRLRVSRELKSRIFRAFRSS